MKKKKKKSKKRIIKILIPVLLLLFLLGIWLLISHEPNIYNPTKPANPNQVSPYLTHKLGPDFYNQVQLDEPFELIIDQAGLNDILSRYPWPLYVQGIYISMPTLVISPEQVILMATVKYQSFESVVSVFAFPSLDTEGNLAFNIQSVTLGAIPVTAIARLIAENFASQHGLTDSVEPIEIEEILTHAILANRSFNPVFDIAEHKVLVKKLQLQQAQAKVLLVPILNDNES